MTDTPRLWDRRADETPKSYAAFLAYVALGARRSIREAAHQNHIKTISTGEISSVEDTTVRTWLGWSARHKWVSRSLARDEWIRAHLGRPDRVERDGVQTGAHHAGA